MFKSTRDIVSTYVNLEIATRTRLRDLWAFIRDNVEDPETFKAETIDSLVEVGCDPKKFRDEFNLATAMGPHDDERSHPYAFTPQMQSAIGKVAAAAKCDRDEAYDLICDTHPTTGSSAILKCIPEIAGTSDPDAALKAAIEMVKANAESPLVKGAGIIVA